MPAGRKSQPLFDLLRSKGTVNTPADRRNSLNPGVGWRPGMAAGGSEPAATPSVGRVGSAPVEGGPPIRLEVKPTTATPSREHVADQPPHGDILLAGGRIRIPLNALSLTIAAIIAIAVLAYAVGSNRARKKAELEVSREIPAISEPIDSPRGSGQPALPSGGALTGEAQNRSATAAAVPPSNDRPAGNNRSATPSAKPPAGARALTSAGWLDGDPRQNGQNYLLLASLNQTEAESGVAFLAENGLETFALYLDPATVRVNNSDPTREFRLYVSAGISSDQYSKRMAARTSVEAAVARLGPRWQKERKGSSNFARPDWQKMTLDK